jgi:hypothetical protein
MCSSFRSISLPSSIETISSSCFGDCENLTSLVFEGGCRLSDQSLRDLRSKCEVTFG